MRQISLNNKLIAEISDKIEISANRNEIEQYIGEVMNKCATLCNKGESLRVLTEIKLLFDNLRKELDI